MVERAGLEIRCTASRYRGFESHLLRSSESVPGDDQETSLAALSWSECGEHRRPVTARTRSFQAAIKRAKWVAGGA